jgi:hypothetical protein
MSLNKEAGRRFWLSMGERFGKRWLDDYGAEPTKAWMETLGGYSLADIGAAMDLMKLRGWQHPPTEPQFAQLLAEAARRNQGSTENYRRGFWRSFMVAEISDLLGYRFHVKQFEDLIIANKHSLGAAMLSLLNELDQLEIDTGQRTPGQLAHCAQRCKEIAANFVRLKREAA